MSSATKVSFAVTSRYAATLIDLADQSGVVQVIENDVANLLAAVKNSSEFRAFLKNPSFSRREQTKAVSAIAQSAKLNELTVNFLGVLVENRRLYALESILLQARAELIKRRGDVVVKVQTARDLDEQQKKHLHKSLSQALGKNVVLETFIHPEIMGGMIVTVGSRMIDDSVRGKLEMLGAAMARQASQNINSNMKEVA